jgi:hypothetical protein
MCGGEEHFKNFGLDRPNQQNRPSWQHCVNTAEAVRKKEFSEAGLERRYIETKNCLARRT